MSRNKAFCLTCYESNMRCKCEDKNAFGYSHKLRVPSTKNKVRFRKFLDDCPIFVNCVSIDQKEDFLKLLKYVKYFEKRINGNEWTYIEK